MMMMMIIMLIMAWRVIDTRTETVCKIWDSVEKMMNMLLWTADKGWSSSLGIGRGASNFYRKKTACSETLHSVADLAGFCEHGNELSGPIKGGKFLE